MKILSVCVLRWNSDTEEPVILDGAYNLADYSYFTRGSVQEFLVFANKVVMKRVPAGVQGVDYEGNKIYCFVQADGLGVLITADKDYKSRVAIAMAKELMGDFRAAHPAASWRGCTKDGGCKLPKLEMALRDYQDPTKVDKIEKLHAQLSETKEVMVQAIEKVLQRGEKLDDLVEKSNHLASTSKVFYRKAKETVRAHSFFPTPPRPYTHARARAHTHTTCTNPCCPSSSPRPPS